jgi:aminopeptidase
MKDPRLSAYAELLVNHSMTVKKGDKVMITGGITAAPLMEELVRHALRAGGFPTILPTWDALSRIKMAESSLEQLSTVTDVEDKLLTGFDCAVFLRAPENTRSMTDVSPERMAAHMRARQSYNTHLHNNVRWVTCNYPCQALAQDADMALEQYADFVFQSCLIDWKQTETYMNRIKSVFDAANLVRLVGPETDLRFSIAGRAGVVCAGTKNMPDGEVFYAPVEDSAEGHVAYDFPAIYQGREVDGVRLRFSGGRVTDAAATKGEDFLLQVLETDPGARRLGEFGIGCNFGITGFTRDILFDEKIGGTIHLAVGRAYEESGGTNKSAVHWDMIKDLRVAGRIELDGRIVQENGEFRGM